MPENGKLTKAELAPIPGGELCLDAAAAWNAPHGPADSGLLPEGPEGSYRDVAGQEKTWAAYRAGGPLAAEVGTSLHGMGVCVDLKETWMRTWIDEHGAVFGWAKTEAFSEWWHVNFVGGVHFPTFDPLQRGSRGKRVLHYTRRLAFIRRSHGPAYLQRAPKRYGRRVAGAVKAFQVAYHLHADGVIGPKTAAKIDSVFHRQYQGRAGRARPRGSSR